MFIAAIALAAGLGALTFPHQRSAQVLVPPRPLAHSVIAHGKTKALATGTTVPILGPYGLAVDGNGNLYVANAGSNDVLIYSSALIQQTARTISTGVATPTGVAVDPYGTIFVCNSTTNQVNYYNSTGGIGTYSTGLNAPTEIAVDALDDVFVVNNSDSSLSVFQRSGALDFTGQAGSFFPYSRVTSVATSGNQVVVSGTLFSAIGGVFSTPAPVESYNADSFLSGNNIIVGSAVTLGLNNSAVLSGSAEDASGGLWLTDFINQAIYHVPSFNNGSNHTASLFKSVNFNPAGIAVDSRRGRIYVSNITTSHIEVYDAYTAALIKTLS